MDEFPNSIVTGLPMPRLAPKLTLPNDWPWPVEAAILHVSSLSQFCRKPSLFSSQSPIHGHFFEHQMVPTVVPRGADYGAVQFSS